MEPRFADLHCHPHMRSFNWLHKPSIKEKDSKYNPWWIILSKLKAQTKAGRASSYSQCDLVRIMNGNMKLAFVSLYPTEQGWVKGRKGSLNTMAINLKKVLGNNQFNQYMSQLVNNLLDRPTFMISQDKGKKLALRDIIQKFYMNVPFKRVNFIQSKEYNYFKELNEERVFVEKGNNKEFESKLYIPSGKRLFLNKQKLINKNPRELKAKGTYEIAKNGKHVKEIIENDHTAFVYTIEGANVFNTYKKFEDIKSKILEVKQWEYPLFFISLCHHFDNFLAGHAHSIPGAGNLVLDQEKRMNKGFEEKGHKVTRLLLSIDREGNYKPEKYGRRILIDVKHLSAKARKQYYKDYVNPSLASENPIPVVASHVAFSGESKLKTLIDNSDEEEDGNLSFRDNHGFNNWNINLCDEDIINIYKSGGLIGINLDQRVLGMTDDDKNKLEMHAYYVWQNLKVMMNVIINSDDPDLVDKNYAANMFCLGTDFDGFIDPINKYPTVLEFEDLHKDLIAEIDKDADKSDILRGLTIVDFVDKFCFDNAYDFVVRNF